MKKILYSLLLILIASSFLAQAQEAAVKIDGQLVYLKAGNSLPYWLKAGQSIAPSKNVSFLSGIEFNSDSTSHVLKYDQVIKIASLSTVPAGKAWKIEAIAYDTLIAANLSTIQVPSNGTYSSGGSGGSTANTPILYQSPKVFSTAGTYTWVVPPGVTSICIEIWGGGGRGGSANAALGYISGSGNVYAVGGGGGAGAYGYGCFTVIPNTSLSVTVGAGSTVGNGGNSSVGSLVFANGGSVGATGYGTPYSPGLGGLSGSSNASFTVANYGQGKIGASNGGIGGTAYNGGDGGIGGTISSGIGVSGQNGIAPGGGGGGAKSLYSSGTTVPGAPGAGGDGQVIIYW